jgi:hypothetical protein
MQLIGYYKISIFDFSNEIELHAGITLLNPFLNRSYFNLTKQFVWEISVCFPSHHIAIWVDRENKKILSLLDFVGFQKSSKPILKGTFEHYFFPSKN